MYNHQIAEIRLTALRVADGRGTESESRGIADFVLDFMTLAPTLIKEDVTNGWTLCSEEMLGLYAYLLVRTLPDGRHAYLSMQLTITPPMAQVWHIQQDLENAQETVREAEEGLARIGKALGREWVSRD